MRYSLALFLIICEASDAAGQSPAYSQTGFVQDPSNAGVEGATLTLKRSDGSGQQTNRTDALGAFRFERLAIGAYELQVEKAGFKTQTSRLRIGSRAPSPIRITLSLADVRQEITVSTQAMRVSSAGGLGCERATTLLLPGAARSCVWRYPTDRIFVGPAKPCS